MAKAEVRAEERGGLAAASVASVAGKSTAAKAVVREEAEVGTKAGEDRQQQHEWQWQQGIISSQGRGGADKNAGRRQKQHQQHGRLWWLEDEQQPRQWQGYK